MAFFQIHLCKFSKIQVYWFQSLFFFEKSNNKELYDAYYEVSLINYLYLQYFSFSIFSTLQHEVQWNNDTECSLMLNSQVLGLWSL